MPVVVAGSAGRGADVSPGAVALLGEDEVPDLEREQVGVGVLDVASLQRRQHRSALLLLREDPDLLDEPAAVRGVVDLELVGQAAGLLAVDDVLDLLLPDAGDDPEPEQEVLDVTDELLGDRAVADPEVAVGLRRRDGLSPDVPLQLPPN